MDSKTRGWIQLIGALLAGWFGWQSSDWGVLVLAIVILVNAHHHITQK